MIERISASEAMLELGYKDKRSLYRWCARNAVGVLCDMGSKKKYLIKEEFNEAKARLSEIYLLGKYGGKSNPEAVQATLNVHAELMNALASIKQKYSVFPKSVQPQNNAPANMYQNYTGGIVQAVEENKPLDIPPNKQWKGLRVYCYRCNTNVTTCKETGKPLPKCPFGNRHAFKVYVHVPGTKNERKTKTLETRDINEAIKQAIDFEREVKGGGSAQVATANAQRQDAGNLLTTRFTQYIAWLENDKVPEHRKIERSREHIRDVKRALQLLLDCLTEQGYDMHKFRLEDMNDEVVGHIYTYLLHDKKYSNRSINKHLSYYTSFLKYEIEVNKFKGQNWFEAVRRGKISPKPQAIKTRAEFEAVVRLITPDNRPIVSKGKKTKRFPYYEFLPMAYRISLACGRRAEEVCNLKWDGYHEDETGTAYLTVEDFKANRIRHRANDEKKILYIPVTEELRELLEALGLHQFQGTDRYILAPELAIDRQKIMPGILSRGFSLFHSQLKTGRHLTYKSLRKTFISQVKIFLGGNAKAITQHSSEAVIDKYYLDKEVVAKAAQGFELFKDEPNRTRELEAARNGAKGQNKPLELDQ